VRNGILDEVFKGVHLSLPVGFPSPVEEVLSNCVDHLPSGVLDFSGERVSVHENLREKNQG
jgi:hypothetical protein